MARRKKGTPVVAHVDTSEKDPAIAKARAKSKAENPKPEIGNSKPKLGKPDLPKVHWLPGQPTKYRQEYCALLVWHMANGLSFETFGALDEVMVGRTTLYSWLDKHAEFQDAKEMGEFKCRMWWESLGSRYSVNNLRGSGESINAQVYKINMHNRFGWGENQNVKHGGKLDLHDAIMKDLHGDDKDDDDAEEE